MAGGGRGGGAEGRDEGAVGPGEGTGKRRMGGAIPLWCLTALLLLQCGCIQERPRGNHCQ